MFSKYSWIRISPRGRLLATAIDWSSKCSGNVRTLFCGPWISNLWELFALSLSCYRKYRSKRVFKTTSFTFSLNLKLVRWVMEFLNIWCLVHSLLKGSSAKNIFHKKTINLDIRRKLSYRAISATAIDWISDSRSWANLFQLLTWGSDF